MLSIIIAQWDDCKSLKKTLQSISYLKEFRQEISIIINQMTNCVEVEELLDDFCSTHNINIKRIKTFDLTTMEGFHASLHLVESDYVLFLQSGDEFPFADFQKGIELLQKYNSIVNIIVFKINYSQLNSASPFNLQSLLKGDFDNVINLSHHPDYVPISIYGYLYNTSALKSNLPKISLKYDSLLYATYSILLHNPNILYVPQIQYNCIYLPEGKNPSFPGILDKDWYFESFENFTIPLCDSLMEEQESIPQFLQYGILYQIKSRFNYNANLGNKHVIDDCVDEFFMLCANVLKRVSSASFFYLSQDSIFYMSLQLKSTLLYLKYNGKYKIDFDYSYKKLILVLNGTHHLDLGPLNISIDLLDFVNNSLIIEASTTTFPGFENITLHAALNDENIEITETYRYAHTKFFGVSTQKSYTFRIVLPLDSFGTNRNKLVFYYSYKDLIIPLSMETKRYTARIDTKVKHSYWKFHKNYMARFVKHQSILSIEKISRLRIILQEIKMLINMLHGQNRSRNMFLFRLLYWLTYPYMKKKTIWLTYDKLYKGGDCGEYLYRYMCTRKENITPAYVINKNCKEYKQLIKEGYHPLKYGSLKHRLYYVHSSVVFTTHGGVHNFNDFSNKQVKFIQGLLHHDVACIQHGLSVQQLAYNSNRLENNMKRYYCASKYEIDNLSHPIYGYEDKSILRLTGIPRYDGLINNDKKQILITPTWRNYIAMPASTKNNAKPYNPDFIKTDYFKIYNKLLSDKKLIQSAKKNGYTIIYLLHPVISAQVRDYPQNPDIKILPATDVNYEKILTESSLMVTDYSGVQFDFAYMRKPVIYYHPPELPPHYKEGGFFYDTMGFGEICTEHNTLVEVLCNYMQSECKTNPSYKARQDDFFAFSDLNSCKRIYNDMLEYQNSKL